MDIFNDLLGKINEMLAQKTEEDVFVELTDCLLNYYSKERAEHGARNFIRIAKENCTM